MSEEYGSERETPVGTPVVRADPEITGERAAEVVSFDPDDPDSVDEAATVVHEFATGAVGGNDHVLMLRGAAACAALVRGVGSYKAAAEKAGEGVTISFIRKWARVHDLPQSIRRHVARGHIAPTAAKHIARVPAEDRYLLAWASLDAELTVRDIRSVASAVNNGTDVETALQDHGITPGRLSMELPSKLYIELRHRASMTNRAPGDVVADALADYFAEE
ncbi:hypothetical protein halTADL_2899 [Halohasta litchfieldiae]|jgi:hypothetical protein|uniref:DUF7119 domain-containing protein n=1 Tax=Halohasta litchfieldiae TaxID=1073996 RepID=A0A1H6RW08_9EURY|nr:hypothetical protein [Halohasta litchfieldiae]ATW89604.1 hypothetical protein halTADL_2899 [Halohasta litchfieldiae]SEI55715.1 hypothetical protein SAMN05444271_102234 [Halohasta litchfieldiae]